MPKRDLVFDLLKEALPEGASDDQIYSLREAMQAMIDTSLGGEDDEEEEFGEEGAGPADAAILFGGPPEV